MYQNLQSKAANIALNLADSKTITQDLYNINEGGGYQQFTTRPLYLTVVTRWILLRHVRRYYENDQVNVGRVCMMLVIKTT